MNVNPNLYASIIGFVAFFWLLRLTLRTSTHKEQIRDLRINVDTLFNDHAIFRIKELEMWADEADRGLLALKTAMEVGHAERVTLAVNESLQFDKKWIDMLNRRALVESILTEVACGKRPVLTPEQCKDLALWLGGLTSQLKKELWA